MPDASTELLDIVDAQGNPTGKTVHLAEAHTRKLRFRSVHVWLYHDNKILLQRRAEDMATCPGLYDTSVGGHVKAGLTPAQAALAELAEELGIRAVERDLQFVGRRTEVATEEQHDIQYVYLVRYDPDRMRIKTQEDEVDRVRWIDGDTLTTETADPQLMTFYVPHGKYYKAIAHVVKRMNSRDTDTAGAADTSTVSP